MHLRLPRGAADPAPHPEARGRAPRDDPGRGPPDLTRGAPVLGRFLALDDALRGADVRRGVPRRMRANPRARQRADVGRIPSRVGGRGAACEGFRARRSRLRAFHLHPRGEARGAMMREWVRGLRARLPHVRRGPTILLYHRIAETGADPFSLCVSPPPFSQHLAELSRLLIARAEGHGIASEDTLIDWAGAAPQAPGEERGVAPQEVGAMDAAARIELGAHSVSHPLMSRVPYADQLGEALQSKRAVE